MTVVTGIPRSGGGKWPVPKIGEILGWLEQLDDVLDLARAAAQERYGVGPASDPYRGLYVGLDELDRLVARAPGVPLLAGAGSAEFGPVLGLSSVESAAMLLALAPEIDGKYGRIYGYLQDDVTRRQPTVGLVLDLFCQDAEERLSCLELFDRGARLRADHLIEVGDDANRTWPLIAQPLRLDRQVRRLFLGGGDLDERLASVARLSEAVGDVGSLPLTSAVAAQVSAIATLLKGQHARVQVTGRDSRLLRQVAEAMVAGSGRPMLTVDPTSCQHAELIQREARWQQAVVVAPSCDVDRWCELLGELDLVVVTAPETSPAMLSMGFLPVVVPPADLRIRSSRWLTAAQEVGLELAADEVDSLARSYRLSTSDIDDAVRMARTSATLGDRTVSSPRRAAEAAGELAARGVATVARQVELCHRWEDLVFPRDTTDQLRELSNRVRLQTEVLDDWGMRRGSTSNSLHALFSGPSGTGKTAAAQIVAGELGLQLWRVELSTVVSKYIGETEKNLDRIFTAAKTADVVLIFDEADALFGKRSAVRDSHDRYANVEISYLLQRMEEHDGVTILATNLRTNLDEAFLRRLAFDIHFPLPDERDRLLIWQRVFPPQVNLAADLDLPGLAARHRLSGGQIRNVAVASAYLARTEGDTVQAHHVEHAVRREYQKLGRPIEGSSVEEGR
ncbi:ATPase family protein associated with various cellular activities (AAA) [Kribbella steppae]|uniref:ATPase family protein associated with various cellular activities (AAA) n=1 Tax=Kribbella steppae TaxID=2512223 RepID=A0A4R2GZH4_9ACTN|nr:ATP-binding protein [Kribbella steppae]TCO17197.1 ATPase family protein associated with various cellular activities (AAA) [Kribbella steppae]